MAVKKTTAPKPAETSKASDANAPSGAGGGSVTTATAGSESADIPGATKFAPSGAPEQIMSDVDPNHPAVDDNPRANTTVDQNRIDFNDPRLSGAEAVAKSLASQESSKE